MREAIDEAVVDDHAERLGEGVRFPAAVVSATARAAALPTSRLARPRCRGHPWQPSARLRRRPEDAPLRPAGALVNRTSPADCRIPDPRVSKCWRPMRSAPSGTTGDRLRSRSGRDASQSHATAWASASGPEGRVCWSRPIGWEQATPGFDGGQFADDDTHGDAGPRGAAGGGPVRRAGRRTVCGVTSTGRFVLGGSSRCRRRLGRAGRRHRGARAVTPRGGTATHQQRADTAWTRSNGRPDCRMRIHQPELARACPDWMRLVVRIMTGSALRSGPAFLPGARGPSLCSVRGHPSAACVGPCTVSSGGGSRWTRAICRYGCRASRCRPPWVGSSSRSSAMRPGVLPV